jgi:hypothetical protein
MNNFKNILIVILTGLLGLSLFTLPAQSATTNKTPVSLTRSDLITIAESVPVATFEQQVQLAEYTHCLSQKAKSAVADPDIHIAQCKYLRP